MTENWIEKSGLKIGVIAKRLQISEVMFHHHRSGKLPMPPERCAKLHEILVGAGVEEATLDVIKQEMRSDEARLPGRPRIHPHEHRHPAPVLRLVTPDGAFVEWDLPEEEEPEREWPVEGRIAAGTPREMHEADETIRLPESFLKRPTGRYIVRVTGGSMVEAKINDGDYVVVHRATEARDRQVVVVRFADGAVTIKRYRKVRGKAWLQADSAEHPDIPLTGGKTGDVHIIGVVERVITEPAEPPEPTDAPSARKPPTRPKKR